MKYKEFFLSDARINQVINGFNQEVRIAIYQENEVLVGGNVLRVIEKRAYDEMQKKYDALKGQCEAMAEALDHYTKNPLYWDKDDKGKLFEEGPSQPAIKALKAYEKFKEGD